MEAEQMERVEGEIDRIIAKRAAEKDDADHVEELWKDSTRIHNEQRRKANGAEWYDFHERMREIHSRLASDHAEKALQLLGGGAGQTRSGGGR